ncbi:MAG: hypothetical protein ACLGHX_08095 [Acidimicrobiia bacterium]
MKDVESFHPVVRSICIMGAVETYIVRIWEPSTAAPDSDLRGVVRHVGSGEGRAFVSSNELLGFLRQHRGGEDVSADIPPASPTELQPN